MVKKTMLVLTLVLLILIAGCNSEPKINEKNRPDKLEKNLKHYPYFFFEKDQTFNGLIIIDDFAPEEDKATAKLLLEHFKQYDETLTEDIIKTYPEEYWDLTQQNSILIGSCSQEPHNQFINIFVDCLSMMDGQAIIRIIPNHDVWVLNIMGKTPVETRNAVEALMNYEDYTWEDYHREVVLVDGELVVRGVR